ncbi:type 4a pilus biogenesis protein PilO [Actinoplanes sp. TFC3]|uniref:type 4a pilus biogenesis protein PilO n=1 Tax=Actinoplanes sp. TFC3 TaxID=1710355 RepID=UPI00083314A8|nr:type 4a pilus biogenesis protein PilO [Actinoplanes sp. TFC3]
MGGLRADRLWIIAGVVAIAVMCVATWFLLINPQYAEASELRSQTDSAVSQASTLRKRIVALKKEKANLKQLQSTLATYQDALPADSGIPAFLRQLQAAGNDLGVAVGGVTVGAPSTSTVVSGVKELPIQLTVTGSADGLNDFLEQLQGGGQKRAVLIGSAVWSDSPDAAADAASSDLSIVLQLKAFVAPQLATGAPAVTTD